jgi:hypothetical protein
MSCNLRVSIEIGTMAPEVEYLWRGNPCCRCHKPLGLDGVLLLCTDSEPSHGEWGAYHAIHKTCLDGKPLEKVAIEGRAPVPLREVLQLALFSLSDGSDGTKDPSTH